MKRQTIYPTTWFTVSPPNPARRSQQGESHLGLQLNQLRALSTEMTADPSLDTALVLDSLRRQLSDNAQQLGAEVSAAGLVADRSYRLGTYKQCFVGSELVDWMIETSRASSREEAVRMGQTMVLTGVCHHVCRDHRFKDEYLFFRLIEHEHDTKRFGGLSVSDFWFTSIMHGPLEADGKSGYCVIDTETLRCVPLLSRSARLAGVCHCHLTLPPRLAINPPLTLPPLTSYPHKHLPHTLTSHFLTGGLVRNSEQGRNGRCSLSVLTAKCVSK